MDHGPRIALLIDALHMLHEQAPGTGTPFRVCTEHPCLIVTQAMSVPAGPAQLSLLGVH